MEKNNNSCPAIYNWMGPSNSHIRLEHQILRIHRYLNQNGELPVSDTAYLSEGVHYSTAEDYARCLKFLIIPRLLRRAELRCSADEDKHNIVFVWNIDDITMLARNFMLELLHLRPDINSRLLRKLIPSVLTSANFTNWDELRAEEVMNIEDALSGETEFLKTVAPKYQSLKDLYNEVSNGDKDKKSIISHELLKKCGMVEKERELCQIASQCQKIYHQRWKCVKKSLDLVNKRSSNPKYKKYASVVITKEEVATAAAQLLISGHSSAIPIDNIYSMYNSSIESVWERIQNRFGEKCVLMFVSSPVRYNTPLEENKVVWQIKGNQGVKSLYYAQRDHLLT